MAGALFNPSDCLIPPGSLEWCINIGGLDKSCHLQLPLKSLTLSWRIYHVCITALAHLMISVTECAVLKSVRYVLSINKGLFRPTAQYLPKRHCLAITVPVHTLKQEKWQ